MPDARELTSDCMKASRGAAFCFPSFQSVNVEAVDADCTGSLKSSESDVLLNKFDGRKSV